MESQRATELTPKVARPTTLQGRYDSFIGGTFVPPMDGQYFSTVNPATAEPIAEVARGNAEDVNAAVHDAHEAFLSWRQMRPVERGRILTRIASEVRSRSEDLARLETLDNGKPLREARSDVELTARYFEFYAGLADKVNGESIPLGPNYHSYTRREPFGVTGHIVPWNAPLQQAARGIAPALATGNTVVAKPAEQTPITCIELASIASSCGLPDGVFNVVPGYGTEAGWALVQHPLVMKISFTGSVETGQLIMRGAADRLLPLTLELGGKSPNIIFDDADLVAASQGSLMSFTLNCGQICSAGTRLLVQASVHDEVVQRISELAHRLRIGPGIGDPDIGPLTSQEQLDKVRTYLRIGADEGATAIIGGSTPAGTDLKSGYFVEPTILVGVNNNMRVAREEIFGPVLSVIKFDDEAEAIRLANDSSYGLVAGIWTKDLSRAHRVASLLDAGQVFVNEYYAGGVETPFGGRKMSGFGREKGVEATHHYTQTKTVTIRL